MTKIKLIYLIEIIEEHLTHLIDRNSGIDWTGETELAHSNRESSQVTGVRVGEEHCINLVNNSPEVVNEAAAEPLVPTNVQQEVEAVHLEHVAVRRLVSTS